MAGPAAGWRTVRVFISSTFRDMQAERDHLVRFVFPRLREELRNRRIHLVDVDLRWGVTAEEDALEVCREIIDECRPRFICILGGRYGWTPPGEERSITADEVHYAALDRLDADQYRYFYFRDPEATASIPEDAARAGAYREFPTEEDIEKYGLQRAEEMAQERTEKLAALKELVRESGLPVFEYLAKWDAGRHRLVGLEEFGEAVYRDLLASIDDEFGEEAPEELDWFAEENAAMQTFIEERTARYVTGSRQALLDEMTAHAEGAGEPTVLVVTGEPGSGKSALLGMFCRDFERTHPEEIIIPHFVGASQGSTSIRLTLRRLCRELAEAAGAEEDIPEDVRELAQAFPELLEQAAGARRVVIIIDALNQLDATDNAHALNWLPRRLPDGVRVLCSSSDQATLDVLRRRSMQMQEVICSPLDLIDSFRVMRTELEHYHKRLDWQQRHGLLEKEDAGNPLYLLTALAELRTLGTFELITKRIDELPGTVGDLFDWILQRLAEGIEGQEAFSEQLVSAYCSYIAVGRGGVTEDELEALCAPVDRESEFWVLHRLMRPHLMRRGRLIDYSHEQFRESAKRRYLPGGTDFSTRHHEVAEHLQSRGYEDVRTLSELPYHLSEARLWDELVRVLIDLRFLHNHCLHFGPFELLRYGELALVESDASEVLLDRLACLVDALTSHGGFLAGERGALVQQLHVTAWEHWHREPHVAEWADQWPALDGALEPLRIIGGPRQPTGPLFRDLGPQEDFVPAIDFTPDGELLFSAAMSGELRRFDVLSGHIDSEAAPLPPNVLSLHAKGSRSVLVGLSDGRVMDWVDGLDLVELFVSPCGSPVNVLAVLADKGLVLAGPAVWPVAYAEACLDGFDLTTGEALLSVPLSDRTVWAPGEDAALRRIVNSEGCQINAICRRPNSDEVAVAFHHGEVSLLNLSTGEWTGVFQGPHGMTVYGLSFDSDGMHMLLAGTAGILLSYETRTWSVRAMARLGEDVTALTVGGKPERVFAGCQSGRIYTLRPDTLAIEQAFASDVRGCVRSISVHPSGALLAASGRSVRLFDISVSAPDPAEVLDWKWEPMAAVGSLAAQTSIGYSSTGQAHAAGMRDGRTVAAQPLRMVCPAETVPIAVAASDDTVGVVSTTDLSWKAELDVGEIDTVHGLAMSADGTKAACLVTAEGATALHVFSVGLDGHDLRLLHTHGLDAAPGLHLPMVFSAGADMLACVVGRSARTPHPHQIEYIPVAVLILDLAHYEYWVVESCLPVGSLSFSVDNDLLFIGPG
ncbi:MAG: DUF4062 domain-containing protein, partial [Armatimonadota bacterium]